MLMAGIDPTQDPVWDRHHPEVKDWKQKVPVSLVADTYSLGIILMELSGGRHPLHPFERCGVKNAHHVTEMCFYLGKRRPNLEVCEPKFPITPTFKKFLAELTDYDSMWRVTDTALEKSAKFSTRPTFKRWVHPRDYDILKQINENLRKVVKYCRWPIYFHQCKNKS